MAKVTTRRARKGFSLKYNPDAHWSAAFYKGLSWLQYSDGADIVNINRDDASGFRLNTLVTHSQHPSPTLQGKPIVTTRTDFVSKYPAVLQTSCYNFAETTASPELCAGIVKAAKIFPKNPAQHFTDLQMLQLQANLNTSAFVNPETSKQKRIECIRVDGAGDEGPSHLEVQYYWTKRHLEQGYVATLVTARSSGSSYLNRVELQNGCLALAHCNLFIPSTLNGSCLDSDGEFCEEKLIANLDAATDVYIERCSGAPCCNTNIMLFKGSDSSHLQKVRPELNMFLKSKKGKEKLKSEKPELYEEFSLIWSLRNRHMVDGLPSQYVFYLLPCYLKECDHPVCRAGKPSSEFTWFKNGPPLSYLPFPVADKSRPWGHKCDKCSVCYGHFMDPKEAVKHSFVYSPPPSETIGIFFKKVNEPTHTGIQDLSKEVLLSPEDVTMWLDHLRDVQINRKKGAVKAAQTRRRKKIDYEKVDCQENTTGNNDVAEECGTEDNEEGEVLDTEDEEPKEIQVGSVKSQKKKSNITKKHDETVKQLGRNGEFDVNDRYEAEEIKKPEQEEFWCSTCKKRYEEKTTKEEIWIECELCLRWFHINCVEVKEDFIPDIFVCYSCEVR